MKSTMLRIGVVPYLNAIPLYRYLQLPVSLATPAELEKQMEDGVLDIALLPAISFLKNPSYLSFFEGGVIQSEGRVESVVLFYKDIFKSPQEVQSIHYTPDSKTSVALFKVLYSYYWEKNISCLKVTDSDPDSFLLIGDEALFFNQPGYKQCDLGQQWHQWTGLPFLYAFWVSKIPLPSHMALQLKEAKKKGLEKISEIIQSYPALDANKLTHYFTQNIHYDASQKSLDALGLYQDLCLKLGLLTVGRNISGLTLYQGVA